MRETELSSGPYTSDFERYDQAEREGGQYRPGHFRPQEGNVRIGKEIFLRNGKAEGEVNYSDDGDEWK